MRLTTTMFAVVAAGLMFLNGGCSNSSIDERDGGDDSHVKSSEPAQHQGVIPETVVADVSQKRSTATKQLVEQQTTPTSIENQESDELAQASEPASNKANAGQKFDWPHWRGPNRNGISNETGLIRNFPDGGPTILWRVELGSGFSGIAVSGNRVFTLFGEGGREKVVCFSAGGGRQLWKIDSDTDFAQGRSFGPRAMPCVDGEHVYCLGASGRLMCLEAAGGKIVWSFNLYEKFNMQRFIHEEGLSCSPIIDGNRLIVLGGNSAFALNKTDGKLIWRSLEEKMNHTTPVFAELDGRRQMIVLTGSNIVGLDSKSGKELWRHEQRGANCATPVVGPNDQIFTAASYGFGCQLVKIADGDATQVYRNNALATHHATAVLYKGHLYGFHDRPGIFKCVEFATGKEKWVSRSPGKGKLIIADGLMILVTEYGELVLAAASPDGITETAKARILKGTCYTAPTLTNGMLYLRSDQEMVCVKMKK